MFCYTSVETKTECLCLDYGVRVT
ncbi:hypothetical protein Gotur_024737 [Gossypium turneri]